MSTAAMKKSTNSITNYFEQNRYVYLSEVLSKEECARLTKHMFDLKEQGKLVQDEQCPLSWSVYGDPELDALLAKLAKPLSQQLDIELLPTYTYARLYAPGEILKRHTDRESCEISGTLTLGHDEESEIWPIFFSSDPKDQAGKSITIDVGDMVMYRGNELNHWRPAYIGRWQVQVFFHFVDANGPHKNWANDKRVALGTTERKNTESFVDKMVTKKVEMPVSKNIANHIAVYNGVMLPQLNDDCPGFTAFHSKFRPELTFTKEECAAIINMAKSQYGEKARVGTSEEGKYAEEVRRVEQFKIALNNNTKWIYDKLAMAVSTANHEYFRFDLMGITHELQLLHYKSDEKGFYDWHVDVGQGHASTRKLSLVAMLSDPSDYEGGQLIINNFGVNTNANAEAGSINMFPSYLLHTVTPVTKGNRWVLVIWIHGNRRFS